MISVSEAQSRIFDLLVPLPSETVPLVEADGRVLAADAVAARDQPPFDAAAMDGYALRSAELRPGASFRVIGDAPAGQAFAGSVPPAAAVRIFTGAPMPAGTDRVVIQEDVAREGDTIRVAATADAGPHVRPAGGDLVRGARLAAGRRLRPADLMLLAAMNVPQVSVARRPVVAILATGDELVPPGVTPRDDQIVASNGLGLAALLSREGAVPRLLPIVRDEIGALRHALELARDADLVVTTGGASVGDHDLMARAAAEIGLERSFYRVAMRPGKPLMAGRIAAWPLIGLPGNPVSAFVCGHVFLRPAVAFMQGLPAEPLPRRSAPLAAALAANGSREHYMRARWCNGSLLAAASQDSSLQRVLSESDALIVRPPGDPGRPAGATVEFLEL